MNTYTVPALPPEEYFTTTVPPPPEEAIYDPSITICFCERGKPFFKLSNYYRARIVIANVSWPTTEHYYQAMKFYPHDSNLVERIRKATTPARAKQIASDNISKVREDWPQVNVAIMKTALR